MRSMEEIIKTCDVTLTDKILFFPCLIGRAETEDLPYLIYPNSDVLVLPFCGNDLEYRFVEGMLKIHCPDRVNDTPLIYRKHRGIIETRLLELMEEYHTENYGGK